MNTLSKKTLALAIAMLAAGPVVQAAQAQELKIGYVDTERLLRESAPALAAHARLEAEFTGREKSLSEAETKLKSDADKLNKDAPTLSESERGRRQRELIEQDRDISRKRSELQEDEAQRRNEETAQVLERCGRVIKQIFDTEHYDLIVHDAEFASPRVDITKKVLDALNAGK